MMATPQSAGLLMYRRLPAAIEVLLVHPGGPYWRNKDDGAWSIPKGVCERGENALATALREFHEETGFSPSGHFIELGAFRQPGGKIVIAFAVEGDADLKNFRSDMFTMMWPPRSGRVREFPEADRAGWFTLAAAEQKILKGQRPILAAVAAVLGH